MSAGKNQPYMKAMLESGWEYLGDHRFRHPHGKEIYGRAAWEIFRIHGNVDLVVFYAHDSRDDEPVTERIAEEVYGSRHRCLSHNSNL